MRNKWAVETTKFGTILFIWDSGNSTLSLHDKQLNEAMKIAKEFGYRPFSFFRPPTWGNACIVYNDQVSGAGELGTLRYTVPATQQKQILKSGI